MYNIVRYICFVDTLGSENDGEYDISDAEDDIDEDEELSVDKHL